MSKKKAVSGGVDLSNLVKTTEPKAVTVPVSNVEKMQAQVEAQGILSGTTFTVIKHLGDPNKAFTAAGDEVHREQALFNEESGEMVDCLQYDNHFIYENPAVIERNEAGSIYLCTCGAAAVIVLPPIPAGVPSEVVGKLVCVFDANTGFRGKHVTDNLNASDFTNRDLSEIRQLPQ